MPIATGLASSPLTAHRYCFLAQLTRRPDGTFSAAGHASGTDERSQFHDRLVERPGRTTAPGDQRSRESPDPFLGYPRRGDRNARRMTRATLVSTAGSDCSKAKVATAPP